MKLLHIYQHNTSAICATYWQDSEGDVSIANLKYTLEIVFLGAFK
jgi:hypothetical protein